MVVGRAGAPTADSVASRLRGAGRRSPPLLPRPPRPLRPAGPLRPHPPPTHPRVPSPEKRPPPVSPDCAASGTLGAACAAIGTRFRRRCSATAIGRTSRWTGRSGFWGPAGDRGGEAFQDLPTPAGDVVPGESDDDEAQRRKPLIPRPVALEAIIPVEGAAVELHRGPSRLAQWTASTTPTRPSPSWISMLNAQPGPSSRMSPWKRHSRTENGRSEQLRATTRAFAAPCLPVNDPAMVLRSATETRPRRSASVTIAMDCSGGCAHTGCRRSFAGVTSPPSPRREGLVSSELGSMRPRHPGAMPPMTDSVKDRIDVADLPARGGGRPCDG